MHLVQRLQAVHERDWMDGEALMLETLTSIRRAGADVILIDTVPTPALYFADKEFGTDGGIMITGSHNPPEYNGIKMVAGGGSLYGEAIQDLYRRIEADDYLDGAGTTERREILERYVEAVSDAIDLPVPIKVVLDCGNGTGSVVAGPPLTPALLPFHSSS